MDTGPLITLAVADSLDYLLYPKAPVYVPDAVFYEATREADALGAQTIIDWAQANSGQVHLIVTQTFANFSAIEPGSVPRRDKDLGERAAIEAIHDGLALSNDERALLITEDDKVLRRVLITEPELSDHMIPITTRDFLIVMEAAGRINSADEVYRRAEDAGRTASRRQALVQQHDAARLAVEGLLKGRGPAR